MYEPKKYCLNLTMELLQLQLLATCYYNYSCNYYNF